MDWLKHQAASFPSIHGLLVLDDLIGFLGKEDFKEFALPYFKRICDSLDVRVKALHNDCYGMITARRLGEMGFNLFNFSFEHGLDEMKQAAGETVTLLGNVPPRYVLARGIAADVSRSVRKQLGSSQRSEWLREAERDACSASLKDARSPVRVRLMDTTVAST